MNCTQPITTFERFLENRERKNMDKVQVVWGYDVVNGYAQRQWISTTLKAMYTDLRIKSIVILRKWHRKCTYKLPIGNSLL